MIDERRPSTVNNFESREVGALRHTQGKVLPLVDKDNVRSDNENLRHLVERESALKRFAKDLNL